MAVPVKQCGGDGAAYPFHVELLACVPVCLLTLTVEPIGFLFNQSTSEVRP